MRFPYPERFRWKHAIIYIFIVLLIQLIEGTDIGMASLYSVYVVLFVVAFNISGGLYTPSGAFIFFTGMLTAIVGFTCKIFTGEPAQSNLLSPTKSMLVYCGSMAVMVCTAVASKRLRTKKPLLVDIAGDSTMLQAAVGCLLVGLVGQFIFGSEFSTSGTIGSAFRQFNRFPQMAILLATTYELRRSNGQRAANWVVYVAVSALFALGVIYSSKEGMFLGPVTWSLAALAGGYNFRSKNIFFGGIAVWFMVYYMVPYSQYVRQYRDENGSRSANTDTTLTYIFRLGEIRELYLAMDTVEDYEAAPHLYKSPKGLIDRLSMFAYDDALISRTDQGYVFGLEPTFNAFVNIVPRFLWPDKPFFYTSNAYGRELGVIGDSDITTGISFSPTADAYHEATWFGIFVVWSLVSFLYFFITDSLTGDVRQSPWGLLPIALVSHIAPEGLVDGVILQFTYGSIGIIIVAWSVRYVFPVFVRLLSGGDKTIVRKTRDFKIGTTLGVPAPTNPFPPSQSDPSLP